MAKTTSYPAYSGGSVNINGVNVANTNKLGNTINSNYNMSENENKIYNSIQNNFSKVLDNLFTVSDPQRTEWQNQLSAMRNVGLQNINDIYTPLQTSLKNDIASRFGNLDNSIFLDKLSAVTNNKAKAVADLANNLLLSSNDLYNQEIQNRMNMLSLLNNLNNSIHGNILSYLGLANQNANSGNQYNQNAYQTISSQHANSLGRIGSTALGAYGAYTGNPFLMALSI